MIKRFIERIKRYCKLRKSGKIAHPWKLSGDKNFFKF